MTAYTTYCCHANSLPCQLSGLLIPSLHCLQAGCLPETLASICNNITFTDSSQPCQGFVYDYEQEIAFFKPCPRSGPLGASDMCINPTAYTWLNQGWSHRLQRACISALTCMAMLFCSTTNMEHLTKYDEKGRPMPTHDLSKPICYNTAWHLYSMAQPTR